jgi:hypothetical protein
MLDQLLSSVGVSKGHIREDGSVEAGGLLAVQRDRASVNQKAANVMKLMWLNYMDLECLPHTFSKVGEKMPLSALTAFRDDLMIALNSQAFKAHCLRYILKTLRKPSATRWWSTWELYAFLLSKQSPNTPSYFEKVLTACREAVNAQGQVDIDGVFEDSVRVRRLHDFAQDVERVEAVSLELSVVVEVFRPFVQATYALEGAGCCIMEVGPWFQYLGEFWRTFEPTLSFPQVRAAIESIAAARVGRHVHPDHAVARQHLEHRVRELVNPVTQQLSFVFNSVDGEMRSDVLFYTFCAALNPYEHGKQYLQQLIEPAAFKAEVLKHFDGRFSPAQVDSMLLELPQFALELYRSVSNSLRIMHLQLHMMMLTEARQPRTVTKRFGLSGGASTPATCVRTCVALHSSCSQSFHRQLLLNGASLFLKLILSHSSLLATQEVR